MQKWKFEVELEVSDDWVSDGFDASERIDEIKEKFQELLPWADNWDVNVSVNIIESPDKNVISKLQGY